MPSLRIDGDVEYGGEQPDGGEEPVGAVRRQPHQQVREQLCVQEDHAGNWEIMIIAVSLLAMEYDIFAHICC